MSGTRRAALLGLLLLAAVRPAAAGDVVSIDATLVVPNAVLPAPKQGGRDLRHAFGDEAAAVIRDAVVRELEDLNAFRAYPDEGGDYRLDIRIARVTRSYRETPSGGEAPSTFSMSLEAECAWSGGGEAPMSVPLKLSRQVGLDTAPGTRELQGMVLDLCREMAQRAFGTMYESRHFRAFGEGGGR